MYTIILIYVKNIQTQKKFIMNILYIKNQYVSEIICINTLLNI